ncbi:putative toxin-antitoxin system toxin component, PIN family [Hanamia caeni]|jgi:putative PIN family toxin of toxin-antitoxin system|uniref:Putative toxin-antitoxin system toxin component, PIN family n=1 Tax=Hanamia caeni TaxID=2294116 RepID=A0A3M9NHZ3_9BACT|nr:putative toxin-antitoxin system toxin component, PIN family [Hanamia caeni]RNI37416.1 putative toxin-antitoxin system toxin component, PIN family [Hanamia caeni]
MIQKNYVIDVNIYISYILKDKLDELFIFLLEKDFEVFISIELINELKDVLLRDKFKKYLKKSPLEFVNAVAQFGNLIEPGFQKIKSPDAKDDYLFCLALASESIIVSGDKPLINWKNAPVQVITLATFFKLRVE